MSLGISPTPATSFPSPPLTAGSLPRGGGILINKSPDDAARTRRISEPTSPVVIQPPSGPPSPMYERSAPLLSPLDVGIAQQISASGSGSGGSAGGITPRIRFAPLPDPTRPRSSSAGTDSTWTGPDGGLEAGGGGGQGQGQHQTVVVTDVKGYDNALESEDDDDDDEAREKRGRRWSKSMSMGMGSVDWGSSWKGTKKILTMGLIGDDEDEAYSNGAPLKKSVSTGGFIGSSPFRWTAETERKKTMLGSSPGSNSTALLSPTQPPAHRRGSSLETSNQLGTSPAKPVKLLNGRVYGGRRASEAAEAEKRRREKNEPAFVEWGAGKSGGGIGSNQATNRSVDDEDGSGMEWVRKRRERREREERERRERESGSAGPNTDVESGGESDSQARNGSNTNSSSKKTPPLQHQTSSSQSSASSSQGPNGNNRSPVTPALNLSELPPTPIIQVSEHLSPSISAPSHPGGSLTPIAEVLGPKPTTPMNIAMRDRRAEHDVFDEDDEKPRENDTSDEEGDSDEEEDEGDFSEDEEEEEEIRTTSTAAGVEKISRHRDQGQGHGHSQPPTPSIEGTAPLSVTS